MGPLTPEYVFRRYTTFGVPESGNHDVVKSEVVQLLNMLFGVSRGGWVVARTLAELNGITPESETDGGVVLTGTGAGYYDRNAGAWVFGRGFPDTFAVLSAIGGSANAITASTATGVNPSNVMVLLLPTPPGTNTSSAVTISLNGGAPEPVNTASGANLSPGDIVAGVGTFLFRFGNEWRQLISSAPGAQFEHQGDYSGGTTYTEGMIVTGSDGNWYQLKTPSTSGDDPVGSVTGNWLKILSASGVADASITDAKLADALTARLANMCSNVAALKALDTTRWNVAYLTLARKQGMFVWRTGDYSAQVTADTTGAIYLKADAVAASSGAWVRETGPTVRPEWFGAVGDGATDDAAAIQAAVNFVKTTGGTVEFDPKGRYGIGSTVVVASYRPVNLVSRMGEIGNNDNAAPLGGYLFPFNSIAGAMIEYTDPTNIDTGYDQHSGTIDGLTFFDHAGNPADPLIDQRVYSVTAGLKLVNFLNANVRNCCFNRIKGSAIWGQFVIKSLFDNLRIHYCGDTGKPALRFESRDAGHYMQGSTFRSFKIEVCMSSYYLYCDSRVSSCTFDDFLYESAPEVASASEQTFVFHAGERCLFTNQHVNRNGNPGDGVFRISGNRNWFKGQAASHSGVSLYLSGAYNRAEIEIYDCMGAVAVQVTGAYNKVSATMQETGAIYVTGSYSSVDDCEINTSRVTSGPVISLGASGASAKGNAITLPSIVAGVHGIQHSATGGVIVGNSILNASTAINAGSSTNVSITGNYIGARTVGVAPGTGTVSAGNVNA